MRGERISSSTPRYTGPLETNDEVLYFDNPGRKFLYKRLLMIALWVVLFTGMVIALMIYMPLPEVALIGPLAIAASILLSWFLAVRALYEWKHTFRLLTLNQVSVIRPTRYRLFLKAPSATRSSSRVQGFDDAPPTFFERIWFKKTRTVSLDLTDSEGNKTSPFDNLTDVRDFEKYCTAVKQIMLKYHPHN